jgi:hypothetical protein
MIDTSKIILYERGQLSNNQIVELFKEFVDEAGGASELLKILLTK